MLQNKTSRALAALLGFIFAAALFVPVVPPARAGTANNYFASVNDAQIKAVTRADQTAYDTTEGWQNNACADTSSARWRRTRCDAAGNLVVTAGGAPSFEVTRQATSTTCAQMPTTRLTGAMTTCVFNEDTAINVVCDDDSTCTSSTGITIEPRTEECFDTTAAVYCAAASGTPAASATEYGP